MRNITAAELKLWLRDAAVTPLLLDVREPFEFAYCRLASSINIPLGELSQQVEALEPNRPTVVICHHGIRSIQAAMLLDGLGFKDVINLQGGVEAWARDVEPEMPRY